MAFFDALVGDKIEHRRCAHRKTASSELELACSMRESSHRKRPDSPFSEGHMVNGANPVESWRQLAAEVAQEDDPHKLAELTDELLLAMEEEKRQSDARLQRSTNPIEKLKSA